MINQHARNRIQDLRSRYPYMFERVIPYGLSIEPGWLSIIEGVCQQIDSMLDSAHARKANFSWIQIKEKFGTLSMYWSRAYHIPESCPASCLDHGEPECVFPETMPEDPSFDPQKETFEEYLASDRTQAWDAKHMIPNPALRDQPRDLSRYFERLVSLQFDEGVNDADIGAVVTAIANAALVPKDVARQIRQIIEVACDEAARTCQFCGAPGRHLTPDGGWMVTACDMHATQDAIIEFRQQERKEGTHED